MLSLSVGKVWQLFTVRFPLENTVDRNNQTYQFYCGHILEVTMRRPFSTFVTNVRHIMIYFTGGYTHS